MNYRHILLAIKGIITGNVEEEDYDMPSPPEKTFFQSLVELASSSETTHPNRDFSPTTPDTEFLEKLGSTLLTQAPILSHDPQTIITAIKPGDGFTQRKVLDIITSFDQLKTKLVEQKTLLDSYINQNPQHNKNLDSLSILLSNEIDRITTLRKHYFGDPLELKSLKRISDHKIIIGNDEDWKKWVETPPPTINLTELKDQLFQTLNKDSATPAQTRTFLNKEEKKIFLSCNKLLNRMAIEREKAIDSILTDDKYFDADLLIKTIKEKLAHRNLSEKDLDVILACDDSSIDYLDTHFMSKELLDYIKLLNYVTYQERIKSFEARFKRTPKISSRLSAINGLVEIGQILFKPKINEEENLERIKTLFRANSSNLEFRIQFNRLLLSYAEQQRLIPTSTLGKLGYRIKRTAIRTPSLKHELQKSLQMEILFNQIILDKPKALANWLTAIQETKLFPAKQLKNLFNRQLILWEFNEEGEALAIYHHLTKYRPTLVKPLLKSNHSLRELCFYHWLKSNNKKLIKKYSKSLSGRDISGIINAHPNNIGVLKHFFSGKQGYLNKLSLFELVNLASLCNLNVNRYLCDPKMAAWPILKNHLTHIINSGITDENRHDFNILMQNTAIISGCNFSTKQLISLISLKDEVITGRVLSIAKYDKQLKNYFLDTVTALDKPNEVNLIACEQLKFFLKQENVDLLERLLQHSPLLQVALKKIVATYKLRSTISEETTKLLLKTMPRKKEISLTEKLTGAHSTVKRKKAAHTLPSQLANDPVKEVNTYRPCK